MEQFGNYHASTVNSIDYFTLVARRFGKQTIDDLVKDIEAFHRRSRDGEAKPFGIVMLYLASHLRMAKPEA